MENEKDCMLPKDIYTTTKEIQKQIQQYRNIEWKSKKNLETFLSQNTFQNFQIVGYATNKTLHKWGEE